MPAAGANDGGGSIRIPAACTGLVGLKTSRGIGPYGPQTGELMFGMVTQGVVSRTVRDSAALLDAIIAPDPSAAYEGAMPPERFAEAIRRAPGTLRVGFSSASAINAHPDREAVAAVERAAALLAELGHEVEEVAPPHDDEALARDFLTIWFAQLYAQVVDAKRRFGAPEGHFEADTLAAAELGRAAGIRPLIEAVSNINDHTRKLARFHETYDVFLTPTLAQPPLALGALDSPMSLQRASRTLARTRSGKLLAASGVLDQIISDNLSWVPYTELANLTGRPAISVPLHWTDCRGAARRAAGGSTRRRRAAAAGRRAARGGAALVLPLRRTRPEAQPRADVTPRPHDPDLMQGSRRHRFTSNVGEERRPDEAFHPPSSPGQGAAGRRRAAPRCGRGRRSSR